VKKKERALREILHRFYEHGERLFTQKGLALACGLSLGTVNPIVAQLERLGAVERRALGFRLTDARRALLYWANTRELARDIAYATRSPSPVEEIEAGMPKGTILTAYSGFRARFGSAPASYEEVHVYAQPTAVRREFGERGGKPNLFVLSPDEHLAKLSDGVAPLAQLYVDLYQLGSPAMKFVEELELKLGALAVRPLEEMIKRVRGNPTL